ncbi:uncharacterized protein LOC130511064 [Raphanus sativus]|uniref:Uncharacterized protein LOC130507854 n=1 Tax=Raphanus sativus TaxID=3726 RepID=A0A9W3D3H8_RAPSA|nr:uncharacterized protein LOC130507854 [Raphanus sativus]XP_056863862.1 uncharacterized protein LOC130511064 [Raphanus sativus]
MKGNNIKNQKRLFPRKGVIQIKMLISISGHLTMDSCIVAIEPSRKFSLFDVMDPERIWLFSKFCIWNRGLHTLYLPETAKAAGLNYLQNNRATETTLRKHSEFTTGTRKVHI